jgi:UDP-N-acetylglucosamine acyltransferase
MKVSPPSSTNDIHPTAIIAPGARLGTGNYIGPFCIIGPSVTLGDRNRLEAYVAIGTPGEHRDYFRQDPGRVVIGDDNVFREHVAITGGTAGVTTVGSQVVLMRGVHLGHDVTVKDAATLSWNVLVAGHTVIGPGANLGLAAVVHQRRVIGAYAMIGMHSTVTRNVLPFTVAFGSPCRAQRINVVALQRSGIAESELTVFEEWFQTLEPDTEVPPDIAHPYKRFVTDYLEDVKSARF